MKEDKLFRLHNLWLIPTVISFLMVLRWELFGIILGIAFLMIWLFGDPLDMEDMDNVDNETNADSNAGSKAGEEN